MRTVPVDAAGSPESAPVVPADPRGAPNPENNGALLDLRAVDTVDTFDYRNSDNSHQTWTASLRRRRSSDRDAPADDEEHVRATSWALPEDNPWRMLWETLLIFMLIYIGTVFPYRLAFIIFRIPREGEPCTTDVEEGAGWIAMDWITDVFFWCDLFLSFFLTYRRSGDQKEEYRLKYIALHYFRTYFFLNFIACLPATAFEPVIMWINFVPPGGCDDASGVNKASLLARMQRMTKIARLTRLVRLVKMTSLGRLTQNSRTLQLLRDMRCVRIMNWVFGLSWIVHLLSCGWYLCAALHSYPAESWVGRRIINLEGETLQTEEHAMQWAHSMYFVLTVFSTVGFGDISAVTSGEMLYVVFTMLVGAVVHSIVVGEMVSVVNELDESASQRRRQKLLLTSFTTQTFVGSKIQEKLLGWVDDQDPHAQTTFDREEMRKLLTAGAIPRKLLGEIPRELFKGELLHNQFMLMCSLNFAGLRAPPRFALLMATVLSSFSYKAGDVVYQKHDHAMSIYLVMSGTFALVAEAGLGGGKDVLVQPVSEMLSDYAHGDGHNGKKTWMRPGLVSKLTSHKLAGRRRSFDGGAACGGAGRKDDERILNLPEVCRSYSSANRTSTCESALHKNGSWTAASSKLGEYMQLDLACQHPVVGVVLQGSPDADEWVTEVRVLYSDDANVWVEALGGAAACFDRATEVYLRFPTARCRFIRLEPTSWHGSIALRAAALVRAPKLSPYRLFGFRSYFGDKEPLLGGTRDSTVRCEADGQVLLIRRGDMLDIMKEFPMMQLSLRCRAIMRNSHRKEVLKKHQTGVNFKVMAADKIQQFWRMHKKAPKDGLTSSVILRKSSTVPGVDLWAKPTLFGGLKHQHSGLSEESHSSQRGSSRVMHDEDLPSSSRPGLSSARRSAVEVLAGDVRALRAEQGEIKSLLQAVLARLPPGQDPRGSTTTATPPGQELPGAPPLL